MVRVVAAASGTFYGVTMKAGDIYTVAGTGSFGLSGDGGPATSAALESPQATAVDRSGNLLIADFDTNRVRLVPSRSGWFYRQAVKAGHIYTIASNGTGGFRGDGYLATSAWLLSPVGLAIDPAGGVLIDDSGNNRIREVAGYAGSLRTRGPVTPRVAGPGGTCPWRDGSGDRNLPRQPVIRWLTGQAGDFRMRRSSAPGLTLALALGLPLAVTTATGAGAATAAAATTAPAVAFSPAAAPDHGWGRPGAAYAPYFETWTKDQLPAVARASGARDLTLAFLQTPKRGSCSVTWNGDAKQPVRPGGRYTGQIRKLRAMGGHVIPSFGGYSADQDGTEIADSCRSVPRIARAYESVVTTYGVTRLDMDVEANSLTRGRDRAAQRALRLLQDWAARTHHRVRITFTLGVEPWGLPANCLAVLKSAVSRGVRFTVNIMAFDYYIKASKTGMRWARRRSRPCTARTASSGGSTGAQPAAAVGPGGHHAAARHR